MKAPSTPSHAPRCAPIVDTENVLLGLAWLGEVTTTQAQRLWMPAYHRRSIQRILDELRDEGYVERRLWGLPRPDGPPLRQDAVWSLSKRGRELLREHDQFPPAYLAPRARRMIPHDTMTCTLIVRVVELARAVGLSGLYVEREVRLDPQRRRPIMDALLMVTLGGAYEHPHLVPWTSDPVTEHERRRRYAVENDRDSEPLNVITGKAHAYQAAATPAWVARYGRFPIPLWLAPSPRRLQAILSAWRDAWSIGKWLLTTDAWLEGDCWVEYDAGQLWMRQLFGVARRQLDPDTPLTTLDPADLADTDLCLISGAPPSPATTRTDLSEITDQEDAL